MGLQETETGSSNFRFIGRLPGTAEAADTAEPASVELVVVV